MRKLVNDAFTGPDNSTWELAHILWALVTIVSLVIVAYAVFRSGQYPSGFGTDLGAVTAGGGASAWARAKADRTVGKDD